MTVPTLNLTDRRDGSVEAFFSQAIFVVDNEGVYMYVSVRPVTCLYLIANTVKGTFHPVLEYRKAYAHERRISDPAITMRG
jgi:hypothetical protein